MLSCPECGRPCEAPQGLGAHRRAAHGISGAKRLRKASPDRRLRPPLEVPLLPRALPLVSPGADHSLRRLQLGEDGWEALCRCGQPLPGLGGSRPAAHAAFRAHAELAAGMRASQ